MGITKILNTQFQVKKNKNQSKLELEAIKPRISESTWPEDQPDLSQTIFEQTLESWISQKG